MPSLVPAVECEASLDLGRVPSFSELAQVLSLPKLPLR